MLNENTEGTILHQHTIIHRFSKQMQRELSANKDKGVFLKFAKEADQEKLIHEIEYHKTKTFVALMKGDMKAVKEHIADTSNFLMALGYNLGLYTQEDTPQNQNQ